MPNIKTGPRVVVSVIATGGGDWQVVSTPTGFNGVTSALFADNDYVHGFVRFENGVDWEEYDTDSDDVSTLLQISNITGTVTIARPATPYASSNGGSRVTAGTGTHTLAISLGSGSMKRFLRETNPTWKTLTSGDATPDVSVFKLFVTNGTTAITRFDGMEDGKVFFVRRGSNDITIQNSADIALFGGSDVTLTTTSPVLIFAENGGVARQVGSGVPDFLSVSSPSKLLVAGQRAKTHFIVKDRDLLTPPGSPAEGDHYMLPAAGTLTGAWSAFSLKSIVAWTSGAWAQFTPFEGMSAYIEDENQTVVYDGSAWTLSGAGDYSNAASQASAAALAAAANAINTTGKIRGRVILDTTNDRLFMALGSLAADKWRPLDDMSGTSDVTPS